MIKGQWLVIVIWDSIRQQLKTKDLDNLQTFFLSRLVVYLFNTEHLRHPMKQQSQASFGAICCIFGTLSNMFVEDTPTLYQITQIDSSQQDQDQNQLQHQHLAIPLVIYFVLHLWRCTTLCESKVSPMHEIFHIHAGSEERSISKEV